MNKLQKNVHDNLASLIEDPLAVNQEKLLAFLKPYLALAPNGQMHFRPAFNGIDNNKKIVVVLAAAAARGILFEQHEPRMAPKEILALQILAPGSVKTAIRTLKKNHKISQDSEGKYYLSRHQLDLILEEATI